MTSRRSSHSLRLTLIVTVLFGTILGGLFGFAVSLYEHQENKAADDELETVLNALSAAASHESRLNEVAELIESPRNPSAAIFEKDGQLDINAGTIKVTNLKGSGFAHMGGSLVRYSSVDASDKHIVVATNWAGTVESLFRLKVLLTIIWFPLTALVALTTWISATRTFRPLMQMALEADRLSQTGPGSRLAVPEDAEFGPLAERLNVFLDRLEEGVRRQARFVTDAAHELRTPLTIVRGQSETALLRERTPEEYEGVLRMVVEEVDRLSQVVNSLLVSSSTPEGPVGIHELAVVVQDTVDRWQPRFSRKGVKLRSRIGSVEARMAPREAETVLDNLLANALRHSPGNSECMVTLSKREGFAEIRVEDQGPGIPDDEKANVFERFYRLDESRNRSEGGFGIGLSICQRLVQQREGKITIEDNDPHGTAFVVRVPY
ncbi:MAG: hypothetical protein JSS66_16205 [Armatimonadetes bacterium]|nr:hypothetical protein [Armatimonadota bacterium]